MARHIGTAVIASLCFMVSACSGGVDASHHTAPSPARSTALTATEKSLLYDAEQTLIQRCMRQQGFRVWKVPEHPVPEARNFPYVVNDAAWAKNHGYGSELDRRARALRTSDPNRRYARSLTPRRHKAALTALHGKNGHELKVQLLSGVEVTRSSDGCAAQAQIELYGDLAAWFRVEALSQELSSMRYRQVVSDPAFLARNRTWSACMLRKGFRYADPGAARDDFLNPSRQKSWQSEKRTALTEAHCATRSGLSATADQLSHGYGAALRSKYPDVFRDRTRMQIAALPRARSIATS